eukprot:scaffold105659_cov66-Phaeocystis_antarctica.AAC.8
MPVVDSTPLALVQHGKRLVPVVRVPSSVAVRVALVQHEEGLDGTRQVLVHVGAGDDDLIVPRVEVRRLPRFTVLGVSLEKDLHVRLTIRRRVVVAEAAGLSTKELPRAGVLRLAILRVAAGHGAFEIISLPAGTQGQRLRRSACLCHFESVRVASTHGRVFAVEALQ